MISLPSIDPTCRISLGLFLLLLLSMNLFLSLLQPITFALVYVGTTLKDLSDVTHGWGEFSKTRWVRAK